MQLNSQNAILWSESSGSSGVPQKTYCATDLIGNIYMASSIDGNGLDWRIVSYRPDSIMRWTYTYNGVGNGNDVVTGIVVDSIFGVYVTGTTFEQSDDMSLLALDSAGNMQWVRHYDRANDGSDISTGITESGNFIYMCGYGSIPTTDNDYSVLKYDKSGLLQWSKHINGTGNGEDRCNAIDVDQNENVYVTGNASVPGGYVATTDILTIKLNSSGAVQWSNYYGMKLGQNDFGNALTADANGQVYVTGQSYVGTTNSDLVLLKYNAATGAQRWVTRYNGVYSGIELGSGIITAANNSVYVIGSTQNAYGNFDFLTIHYLPNGKVAWTQIYDGPVGGADEGRVILEDGDDVVVSGRSMGIKNFDVTTISYSRQNGSINWTIRYDSQFGEEEDVASVARDEMGNVLVGCSSQSGVFVYQPELIKIHQKGKNDVAIERNLMVLATGFSELIADSIFKRVIWYNILRGFDDSIYVMYADQLRSLGDSAGITATTKINNKISATFTWNSAFNWTEITSKQMWTRNGKVNPLMGVPKLYQFDKSQFILAETNVAFTHTEDDYPIGCVTCDGNILQSSEIVGKAAWVFFINIPPFIYAPEKQVKPIVNCFLGEPIFSHNFCEVCTPTVSPFYPQGPGHTTGNHEIGIWLALDPNSDCGNVYDANFNDQIPTLVLSSNYYAVLKALPGSYWRKTNPQGVDVVLYKAILPHITDEQGLYPDPLLNYRQGSNKLTLCSQSSLFHDYGESGRFHLDFGGIYEITRPGIDGLAPMYFYFSPFRMFTFAGGPDMNLNYYGVPGAGFCQNGSLEYLPDQTYANCNFASYFMASFGVSNPVDYFTNPSLSFLDSYWNDNAITVGFATTASNTIDGNYVEFIANNVPLPCDPSELFHQGLVCTFDCINTSSPSIGDGYETVLGLGNNYPQGFTFLVHVQAHFVNGESINQCQYITINQNVTSVGYVSVMIRGDISDYSLSPINYAIDIYEAN